MASEALLRILNAEDDKQNMYKILQCFNDIIDYTSVCIFYSSDLETFIDFALNQLSSTYTDELRIYILQVLEKVTKSDEFINYRYKDFLIIECMECYIDSDIIDTCIKDICRLVLQNVQN